MPDYTTRIDGFTITNSHSSYDPLTEKTVVSGSKTWNHGNIDPANRPTGIIVYIKDGNKIVAEKQITAANEWEWNISVPKYRADGATLIQYTVDEGNVPHYTHTVNGNNITNTYKGMDYPGDTPRTGDNSNLMLWVILMLASATILVAMLLLGKRKNSSHNTGNRERNVNGE